MGTFNERIRQQMVPGRTIVVFDRTNLEQSMPALVLGPVAGDQLDSSCDYVDFAVEKHQSTLHGSVFSDVITMRLADVASVQLKHEHDEEANLHEVEFVHSSDIPWMKSRGVNTNGYLVTTMGDSGRPIFRFFPLDMRFQGLKSCWQVDLTQENNQITWLIQPAMEYMS